MSATELRTALDELETAREHADSETEDRLTNLVEKVESALEDDRTLDHGALAGMTRTLADLESAADDETAAAIDASRDALRTYREGVPGA